LGIADERGRGEELESTVLPGQSRACATADIDVGAAQGDSGRSNTDGAACAAATVPTLPAEPAVTASAAGAPVAASSSDGPEAVFPRSPSRAWGPVLTEGASEGLSARLPVGPRCVELAGDADMPVHDEIDHTTAVAALPAPATDVSSAGGAALTALSAVAAASAWGDAATFSAATAATAGAARTGQPARAAATASAGATSGPTDGLTQSGHIDAA
jgi:hypothetical protein